MITSASHRVQEITVQLDELVYTIGDLTGEAYDEALQEIEELEQELHFLQSEIAAIEDFTQD